MKSMVVWRKLDQYFEESYIVNGLEVVQCFSTLLVLGSLTLLRIHPFAHKHSYSHPTGRAVTQLKLTPGASVLPKAHDPGKPGITVNHRSYDWWALPPEPLAPHFKK